MNLNHQQIQQLIQTSFQRPLEEGERAAVEAHLAGCEQCSAYRETHRALDRRLSQSLPGRWVEPDYSTADLTRRLTSIQTHTRRKAMKRSASSFARMSAATVILILLVIGLAWLVRGVVPLPQLGGEIFQENTPTPRTGSLSIAEAEALVRAYIFTENPDMNPTAVFPLEEITEDAVWERLNAQIFKVTEGVRQNETFLIRNHQVTHLGTSFGGTGVSQLAVTDLDRNLEPELIYAYNFGSGILRVRIGAYIPRGDEALILDTGVENINGLLTMHPISEQWVTAKFVPWNQKAAQEIYFLLLKGDQLQLVRDHPDLERYDSSRFGVALYFPSGWDPVGEDYYQGADGFFRLESVVGDQGISEMCAEIAAANPDRYGANPRVEAAEIEGQEACLIQPDDPTLEAGVAVNLPSGDVLLVRVDMNHLSLVTSTLLIPPSESQASTPPTVVQGPDQPLTVEQATVMVQNWVRQFYPTSVLQYGFTLTDLTPPGAWEQFEAQVYQVSTDREETYDSVLIHQDDVYRLGLEARSLVVSDLDADGSRELAYVFSPDHSGSETHIGALLKESDSMLHLYPVFRYADDLWLEKVDDQTVRVWPGSPENPSDSLGILKTSNDTVWVGTPENELVDYTSEPLGVALRYPGSWQPVGEDRYQGENGYFELTRLEFGAQDIHKACEWEVNQHPEQYGNLPVVRMVQYDGYPLMCKIEVIPGGDPALRSALVLQAKNGEFVALWIDPLHLQDIATSVNLDDLLAAQQEPTPQPIATSIPGNLPVSELTVRQLGDLTLEEYAVVDASIDTPIHFGFNQRIPVEVTQRRAVWRDANHMETLLEVNNLILGGFGYHLERVGTATDHNQDRFDLYRGEEKLMEGITQFYPADTYLNEIGGGDFVMLVEDSEFREWLVRKDSLEPWDPALHGVTFGVISGEALVTMSRDPQNYNRLMVQSDGEEIFSYTVSESGPIDPVKGLRSWNGQWVLEVDGTLIVAGANINLKEGYDEIFHFRMIEGKPFFFFKQAGKVGISYGGEVLDVGYDEVIHYTCCEAGAFDIRSNEKMVWFYALRDGKWHYVELGRFE